jgi:hypothetical protein
MHGTFLSRGSDGCLAEPGHRVYSIAFLNITGARFVHSVTLVMI